MGVKRALCIDHTAPAELIFFHVFKQLFGLAFFFITFSI